MCVCVCVCMCVRACVRARVCARVRVCVLIAESMGRPTGILQAPINPNGHPLGVPRVKAGYPFQEPRACVSPRTRMLQVPEAEKFSSCSV